MRSIIFPPFVLTLKIHEQPTAETPFSLQIIVFQNNNYFGLLKNYVVGESFASFLRNNLFPIEIRSQKTVNKYKSEKL